MKTYFRLLAFAKPYSKFLPRYIVLALLAVIFGLLNFSLMIPLLDVLFNTSESIIPIAKPEFTPTLTYLKDTFNYQFSSIAAEYGRIGALQFVCVLILISVFLANIFRYFSQRVLSSMRSYVVRNIRKTLFEKISRLHLGYFNTRKKGDILSNLTNDVNEIETSVVSTVQVVFREPLMIIGYIVFLFILSAKLTFFTLIVLPISALIISRITKKLRKDAGIVQGLLGSSLSIIEETLSGARIIKAFNAQKFVNDKFGEENEKYRSVLKRMWNRRELASPISEFLGISVVVGVLLYGGTMVLTNQSELSASQFITYIILYSQILVPAKNISTAITNIQRGLISGERIFEIIDQKEEILDRSNASSITAFKEEIVFKNVSFQYGNEPVLQEVNLRIPKGKTIALVGQSGAGKSTLADLLPRFYDVSGGGIYIDGVDIREVKHADLIALMGIVTQESILFNDSVYQNIAFSTPHATPESVMKAAKIANAHEFISQLPQGYETNIGDRGGKLSGGQKQRIAIARAVLKNPSILILDEATSALDTESERLVQDALFKLMQNRTALIIAHRLSTIQHADEIVVMDKGRIIERGTHSQLLTLNGTYKKLCDLQAFD